MTKKNQDLKSALIEMATSDQFVPGICNHCDRWCVHCPKSTKCLSYAYGLTIKGMHPKSTQDDQENQLFWDDFEIKGKQYCEEFTAMVENFPISPGAHELEEFSKSFEIRTKSWLQETGMVEDHIDSKSTHNRIGRETCIEIIDWYSSIIPTKTERALKELDLRTDKDLENNKNPYRDNVGSAKMLLIACSRLNCAFRILHFEHELELDSRVLDLLTSLNTIEKEIKRMFPNAMQFIRPGLDD